MPQTQPDILSAKIAWQRRAMIWERVWQALHWPLMAAGIAIAVIASGLLLGLPDMVRFAVLGLLALGFIVSLRDLFRLKLPSNFDVMRRLEDASGLTHRRISSSTETLVAEQQSDEHRALWEEHKRRQLAGLDHVAVDPPRSAWRQFDPQAFRVPVALAAITSLLLGSGNLTSTVSPAAPVAEVPAEAQRTMDAWLKPPAYTGKPPILLTSPAMKEKVAKGEDITVPENATLTLRVTGAKNPRIEFFSTNDTSLTPLKDITAKSTSKDKAFTSEAKLSRPANIRVADDTGALAEWHIATIPDQPPAIAFTKPPEPIEGGSLQLNWDVKDDYGVSKVTTSIELADEQEDGIGFTGNGPFLFDPPQFPIALKRANSKQESGKTVKDLTAHPWAGFMVTLNASVKDAGGNEGKAAPVTFKLPEKTFTRPLAKALIEQRKRLIMEPENASDVAELFQTILIYPKGLIDRSAIHIRLAAIASGLESAGDAEAVKASINDIWKLALDIEDGSLSDAKAELAELKKELEQALKNGASEEEIRKLMDKMRQAMNRYLDQMHKQAQNGNQKNRQNQNGQSRDITKQDLQKMLDAIEKMSKDGQKDMAQNLLDELDRLLQNLQPGENKQAGEQSDQLGEMLDQLSDMMRQQQKLMDQTQRAPGQGQEPQEGQNGQNGQDGQQGGAGQGMNGLADKQGALKDFLDRLQRELGRDAPGSLGDAGKEMGGAEKSLRDSNREGALQQQGNALDQLRKGAGELSKKRREQGQGQARSGGRDGPGGKDDDPLGRPRATRNPDDGPDKNIVPSEQQARRAREILEALRNRANEEGLTEQEKRYIDRLLEGLY